MDEDFPRTDIRRLLKTFGIQADEAIVAHLARTSGPHSLHLRITLSDITDYGDGQPAHPLHLEIEGDIRR
jgi:hypothetical protein